MSSYAIIALKPPRDPLGPILKQPTELAVDPYVFEALWKDPRVFPAYLCGISFVVLVLTGLTHVPVIRRVVSKYYALGNSESIVTVPTYISARHKFKAYLRAQGGPVVFTLQLLKLFGCIALIALSLMAATTKDQPEANDSMRGQWSTFSSTQDGLAEIGLSIAYIYSAVMLALSLLSKPTFGHVCNVHASFLLLVLFGVFAWRNVVPLTTFSGVPADLGPVWLLWSRGSIITLIGVVIPLLTPRIYHPVDPSNPSSTPNPEQTASILSFLLFSFMDRVVFIAYRLPRLPYESLPPLADYDAAKYLVARSFDRLDPLTRSKKGLKDRHLFFGLMDIFRWEYFFMFIYKLLGVFSGLLRPIGVNRLLTYLETEGTDAVVHPWVWISFLLLAPILDSFCRNLYLFTTTRMVVQAESIITQLVFYHSLKVRMIEDPQTDSAISSTTPVSAVKTTKAVKPKSLHLIGTLNNLVSTDLANITSGRDFLDVVFVPLQMTASLVFLYAVLGWAAIFGMAIMILGFPLTAKASQLMDNAQEEKMKKTDARVQAISETMNILRMVKMFGWEAKVKDNIAEKREMELRLLIKYQFLSLLVSAINFLLPLATMVATFALFTLVMKRDLTASRVFSSMILFESLRGQLYVCVQQIPKFIQAKVSLDRASAFLRNTELLDRFEAAQAISDVTTQANEDSDLIGFHNATFRWMNTLETMPIRGRRDFRLHIEHVIFRSGKINLIIGPTGSGKTSMLMALLGEMRFQPSGADSWFSLPRSQGISYAAQESWLQNESIKKNIVFGEHYDEARYKKVLHQCALEQDLLLFDAGDNTEVGEKGLTLSGGQKARVTLARAIYSRAGVVLLDDVLSALDVHTSRFIVEKLFRGDLIRGRTVILVTHNVALAGPVADNIISLGNDGRVLSQGGIVQALSDDTYVRMEIEENAKEIESAEESKAPEIESNQKAGRGKLVVAEELAEGRLRWQALKLFVEAFGGPLFWVVILLGYFLAELSNVLGIWWLGVWSSAYEGPVRREVDINYYLGIYILIVTASTCFSNINYITFFFGGIRASRRLHNKLLDSVLGSTLRWIDRTPIGRIISKFTQDIREVDNSLGELLVAMIEITLAILMRIAAVVIISPIFLLSGGMLAVVAVWLGQVYIAAQLSVKRQMSNCRSPVYSHFAAAVAGLVSIRAYGVERSFEDEMSRRIDKYSRPARTFYNLNRWIGTRIEILSGLFASSLAVYLVYYRSSGSVGAGTTGFSLDMAIGFTHGILACVRVWNMFEVAGNSLERILDYLVIHHEPTATKEGVPPAYWPASGSLRVENLSARYSEDGPLVLDNISFDISSGERVGIVGRTGSGKSSLALSLLRMIPTTGAVRLDGRPTHETNLDALRSNLTIIPQDPTLISGTLRTNLDPFSQYDDAVLNDALRAAGVFRLQAEDSESRISLDTTVASAGSNFSVGQRQIIALARAIVRNAKVLILDEATASVDAETDNAIQVSIRTELKHATLITIAHRLQTIVDYDRIMVLDAGKLVEFDTPIALLEKEDSFFRALVEASTDRDQLWAAAKEARKM